jgi:hypothetical protein
MGENALHIVLGIVAILMVIAATGPRGPDYPDPMCQFTMIGGC